MPNTPPDKKKKTSRKRGAAGGDAKPRGPAGRGWLWTLAGGVAGAIAFEPLGLWPLAALTPAGIFAGVSSAPTPGAAFRRCWVGAAVMCFGAIHWLMMIGRFAPFPVLAWLGVVLLAFYMGLFPATLTWAVRRWAWSGTVVFRYTLFASAWILGEWLRTQGKLAVPLGQLGHAWAQVPLAIQPAHFTGELGISLSVLWAGALVYLWAEYLRRRRGGAELARQGRLRLSHAVIPTMFYPLLWLTSGLLLAGWDARVEKAFTMREARPLEVAMVQPNVDQVTKFASYAHPDASIRERLREQISQLTERMAASPEAVGSDLLILPESAFTEFDFNRDTALLTRVGEIAYRANAPTLLGANRVQLRPDGGEDVYNSAYLFRPDGSLDEAVYDKIRLVPFGEALPYFELIPGFQENLVGIGSFTAGQEHTLFDLPPYKGESGPTWKLGVLICFESTFSEEAAAFAREGADILAVLTNDAWYGESAGAASHHALSLIRAVETRRWVVRCANTGISSIIAPTGRITASLGVAEQGVLTGRVAPYADDVEPSFYARVGYRWFVLPIGLIAGAFVRRRRHPLDEDGPEDKATRERT